MTKKDYCFLIDTSFDLENQTFADNVYFLRPEIIRSKNNQVETFQDALNISREEILNSINDKYDLKTCQTPFGLIESTLCELLEKYQTVYVILITRDFSGMFDTCTRIAKSLEPKYGKNRIIMIDSKSISMFQNKLMDKIEEMHLNGFSTDEIVAYANDYYKKTYAFTIITNANQLIKGGRLTGLKAILVKAFNIKLLIEYANGKLTYLNKAKDVIKALDLGIDSMIKYLDLENHEIEELKICSDLDEKETKIYTNYAIKKLEKWAKANNINEGKLPALIVAHLGDKSFSLLCKIK